MKSQTTLLIETIVRKLHYYRANDKDAFIELGRQYTGIHRKFLEEVWYSEDVTVDPDAEPVRRFVILEHLMSFYFEYKMPTAKELFMQLYGNIPKHLKLNNFKRILQQMNFTRLKAKEKRLVFEKPKITFRRFDYLKKMTTYRKEDKNIVFICELAYDFLGNIYDPVRSRHLQRVFPVVKQSCWIYAVTGNRVYDWQKIDKFDENIFQDYIIELSKEFIAPTVFVYDKSKHHCDRICPPPTLKVLKVDIIEWLKVHNIPYDPEASKYHLYQLAQDNRDIDENLFQVDNMLIDKGHLVVRIPSCCEELSPGYFIRRTMDNIIKEHNKEIDPGSFTLPEFDKRSLEAYDEKFETMVENDARSILETADIMGQEEKIFDMEVRLDRIMDSVRAKRHEVSDDVEDNELNID